MSSASLRKLINGVREKRQRAPDFIQDERSDVGTSDSNEDGRRTDDKVSEQRNDRSISSVGRHVRLANRHEDVVPPRDDFRPSQAEFASDDVAASSSATDVSDGRQDPWDFVCEITDSECTDAIDGGEWLRKSIRTTSDPKQRDKKLGVLSREDMWEKVGMADERSQGQRSMCSCIAEEEEDYCGTLTNVEKELSRNVRPTICSESARNLAAVVRTTSPSDAENRFMAARICVSSEYAARGATLDNSRAATRAWKKLPVAQELDITETTLAEPKELAPEDETVREAAGLKTSEAPTICETLDDREDDKLAKGETANGSLDSREENVVDVERATIQSSGKSNNGLHFDGQQSGRGGRSDVERSFVSAGEPELPKESAKFSAELRGRSNYSSNKSVRKQGPVRSTALHPVERRSAEQENVAERETGSSGEPLGRKDTLLYRSLRKLLDVIRRHKIAARRSKGEANRVTGHEDDTKAGSVDETDGRDEKVEPAGEDGD